MNGLLFVLGVTVIWMYIVVPLRVRGRNVLPGDVALEALPPGEAGVPAEVSAFWHVVTAQLEPLGFAPVVRLTAPQLMGPLGVYLAYYENRAAGDSAMVQVVKSGLANSTFQPIYGVTFGTDYTDGREVTTDNLAHVSDAHTSRWRTQTRIPRLGDLPLLYRVHQTQVARVTGARAPLPAVEEVAGRVRAETLRDYQAMVQAGLRRLDAQRNQLRLTWKGAFLTTWAQLWPISAIRRALMESAARRALRAAGSPAEYEKVNYARLVRERVAELAAPGAGAGPLQFERVEYAQATVANAGPECAQCRRAITRTYWSVNGQVSCPACRDVLAQQTTGGSRIGRTVRATTAGGVAGLVGAGLYFAVAAITGYELGLIALVVGLLVGAAVRWGARGRGGWFYQLLAIGVTYTAVAASQSGMMIREVIRNPDLLKRPAATAAAPAATVPAPAGGAGARETAASMPAGADSADEGEAEVGVGGAAPVDLGGTLVRLLVTLVVLIGGMFCMPVIIGTQAPISLLITGIALYEAWKINKRPPVRIEGPYTVAGASAARPAAPPTSPEGRTHG